MKEHCSHCGQSLTYELDLDKGSVDILTAIAKYLREKNINAVHPRKELEDKFILTSNQVGNLSRPRFHGLIAKVVGEKTRGNYCITTKGFNFLNGELIPSIVIVAKATVSTPAHTSDHRGHLTSIKEFDAGWGEYWSSNGYTIEAGRVIIQKQPTLI